MATRQEGLCILFRTIWSLPGINNGASVYQRSSRMISCLGAQKRWREVTGAENVRQRAERGISVRNLMKNHRQRPGSTLNLPVLKKNL